MKKILNKWRKFLIKEGAPSIPYTDERLERKISLYMYQEGDETYGLILYRKEKYVDDFYIIGYVRTATSTVEAEPLKYLLPENKRIMNRNSLLEVSKKILNENKDFKAPNELTFNLPGKSVIDDMNKILEKLYNDKVILDHGLTVAKELAHVLSGGETTKDKTLTEDDLFKLELEAFMRLIETKQTQDRIKHTLATGKPLVN